MTWFAIVVLLLVLLRTGVQILLEALNRWHVQAHANDMPAPLKGAFDSRTYGKTVDYTLAKSRFHVIEILYSTCLLLVVIFSGLLPSVYGFIDPTNAWEDASFLLGTGLALSLLSLPLDYYSQFRLEERFGFNAMTVDLWWIDHLKAWTLTVVLGLPLVWIILKFVEWSGTGWWIWAWATLVIFQFLMILLAPLIILPLFNKFEPLPEGSLRDRLMGLATRTGFSAQSVQCMDGSKRSRHSNAFFTGFGNFRKIVLFDTLIAQLQEAELEAVLAHEIGHYKKKHIPKMLAASALGSFWGFFFVALLAQQPWFTTSFGFQAGNITATLLLFGLLSGVAGFWVSPLAHWFSRRCEYQADTFAAKVMQESDSLITALRKLAEKNLSNLTPHPVYSAFYYSHPTLLERETALRNSG